MIHFGGSRLGSELKPDLETDIFIYSNFQIFIFQIWSSSHNGDIVGIEKEVGDIASGFCDVEWTDKGLGNVCGLDDVGGTGDDGNGTSGGRDNVVFLSEDSSTDCSIFWTSAFLQR